MQKWEYLVVIACDHRIEIVRGAKEKDWKGDNRPLMSAFLMELGADGWELVSYIVYPDVRGMSRDMIFKRPKQN